MWLLHPVKIRFPYPIIEQKDIDSLSLPALLWGKRHGFFSFENLVQYSVQNYESQNNDIMISLASLLKNEYSSLGPELLNRLMLQCVVDTAQSHRKSADEVFALLFRTLEAKASAQILINIFGKLAGEVQFIDEIEWTGDPPIAPYIHDLGPKEELITKIIIINAKLENHGVNTLILDELSLMPKEYNHDSLKEEKCNLQNTLLRKTENTMKKRTKYIIIAVLLPIIIIVTSIFLIK